MGAKTGITDVAGSHFLYFALPAHAAATSTESWTFHVRKCNIIEVTWTPSAAITGAATNYTNVNLDIPAGTEVANKDFLSGTDAVANTAISLFSTVTAVADEGAINIEYEKVATGLALPPAVLRVEVEYT